jgi:hypothetical protein
MNPIRWLSFVAVAVLIVAAGLAMSEALRQEPNVIPVPRELMERMAVERLAIISEMNRLEQTVEALERANATLRAKLACV